MKTTHTNDRKLGGPFRGLLTVYLWGLRRTFSGKKAWVGLLLSAGAGALIGAASGQDSVDPLDEPQGPEGRICRQRPPASPC